LLGRRLQSSHGRPECTRAGRHSPINKIPPIIYTLHLSHLSLKFPRNLFSDFGDVSHVASLEARDWLTSEAHVAPEQISFIPTASTSLASPAPRANSAPQRADN